MTVITVENLGKKYRIRHQDRERYTALRDVIAGGVKGFGSRVFGGFKFWIPGHNLNGTGSPKSISSTQNPIPNTQHPTPKTEDFWALKDVSFEVKQGEVVGIIGRNGAGKSTLLKILSRITEPTEGRVRIRGRVASLLEVGTGFHPELTGRENIFLNGAVLGMTRAEIKRKFDEIVAFAEVEKFIDMPVKRYSSGMYVRLAFAVAAHLEPEILLVDEVLAVGDSEFQKKCVGQMSEVARQGRTVFFVSHNLGAIQTLCNRALYLDRGSLVAEGSTRDLIVGYTNNVFSSHNHSVQKRKLSGSLILDSLSFSPNPVRSGAAVGFLIAFAADCPVAVRELLLLFYSELGTRVAIADLRSVTSDYRFGGAKNLQLRGTIRQLDFVEGRYSVGVYINCTEFTGDLFDLCTLFVLEADRPSCLPPYSPRDRGLVDLDYDFQII